MVDAAGRAVSGAEVRVARRQRRGPVRTGYPSFARSGRDGRFQVEGLASDASHAVHVSRQGYSPSVEEVAPAPEAPPGSGLPGHLPELRIVLHEARALRGRAVSQAGDPVAGAGVVAFPEETSWREWRGPPPGLAEGVTGADGTFELEEVLAGPCQLLVTASGYAPLREEGVEVPAGGGVTDLGDLVLEPESFIAGRVVDPEGAPVVDASVQAWQSPRPLSRRSFVPGPGRESVTTGPDGGFRMGGVADGEYLLKVIEDFTPVWTSPDPIVVEGSAPVTGLEIRLPATTTLTGRLVGLEPDELRGAGVQARLVERGLHAQSPGDVLEDGSYRISGLTPGRWMVAAAAPRSGRQAQGRVEVEAGQTEAALDLEFRTGYTVTGTVLSAGEPLAGAQVTVQGATFSGAGQVTTGLDGRFRIQGVSAGRKSLLVQDREAGTMVVQQLQVDGDRDVRVELEAYRVRGAVYAADGSGPVGGAEVQLQGFGARSRGRSSCRRGPSPGTTAPSS